MVVVNVHEAKTRLSQLLAQVEAGEEVVIARAGKHIVRLCLIQKDSGDRRVFGRDRNLYQVPEDFDEPLPDDLLQEFFG